MTNCEQKSEKYHQLQTRVSVLKQIFEKNNYHSRNKSEFDDFLKHVREILNIKKELKELQNWSPIYSTFELSNGIKLELGPSFLEEVTWEDANKKIEKLNGTLEIGEKPWRIPTKEEFEEIGKPIGKIWGEDFSLGEKEKKHSEYLSLLGIAKVIYYWTSSYKVVTGGKRYFYFWDVSNGAVALYDSTEDLNSVLCVR